MRIGINTLIENPFRPTGTTRFLQGITAEFVRLAPWHEYFLFVSPASGHAYSDSPRVQHLNCWVGNERRSLRVLCSQALIPWHIRRRAIDVYFSPQTLSPPFVPRRCRVVTYLYGTHHWRQDAGIGMVKGAYRKLLARMARRRSDVIVANSEACRRDIEANLGPEIRDRVRVVPEGYDARVFRPGALEERERTILADLGVRPGAYVLFVSMIYPYKNLDRLVAAYGNAVGGRALDFDLAVVGSFHVPEPVAYRRRLDGMAAAQGVAGRVKFIGKASEEQLAALYRGAALYVQPSLYETFGKTTLEAMGCGAAVAGSSTGGTRELLEGCAPMFDPTSVEEMTAVIGGMLSDESLRTNCAAAVLKRAREFSFERQARELLAAFDSANKGNGRCN